MATHNELGWQGEDETLIYLTLKGYHLLDRNWRFGHYEIDIVAEWHGEIVFVEVKTRSKGSAYDAIEAVDAKKKHDLITAGRAYLNSHFKEEKAYSFDIITLIGNAPPFEITHIKNAYTETDTWQQRHHKREFEV